MDQSTPAKVRRTRVFGAVLFLVPLAFFAALEGSLRVLEYGGNLNLFIETNQNGKAYYGVNPDVTNRYFRTFQVKAMVSNELFEKAKGENTFRIFCLGESSTLGYPYMFNGSFPSLLRDRLQATWPQKNVEVINLGITAVSSYTVADFVHELVNYQPDALLVYCGHNEFYGALAVGSTEALGKSRWMIQTYLWLEHVRSFLLMRDCIDWIRGLFTSRQNEGREATVMEGMVKNKEIPFDSPDYAVARDNFTANIEEIANVAEAHKIRLVFATLVSNLSGLAPFSSVHGFHQTGLAEFQNHELAGEQAFASNDPVTARKELSSATSIDSSYAMTHFLLGKIAERQGEYRVAAREYQLAKDQDALRFRAPSEFNTIIRQVARKHSIPVADAESLLTVRSEHQIIGPQFVLEHVHLNVDGYFLLAQSFYDAMRGNGILASREQWHALPEPNELELRAGTGVTALDSAMASIRLFVLMNSWPFKQGGIGVRSFDPKTELERLAKSCLMRELSWEQAHVKAAEMYEKREEVGSAIEEYRCLAKATPFNNSPLLRLGQLLLRVGKDDDAIRAFQRALKISPNFHAMQAIAFLHLKKNRFEDAAVEFKKALQYADGVPSTTIVETQQLFAVSLAGSGKLDEAESVVRGILLVHPEQSDARAILERIQKQKGQMTHEAVR
ncbi:MAG TPA: tetratricopeptide repeat protein [Bacteroidota bacterium]|nr:tetratricopeptide repeat protein [Bacteroidota bacterium]